MKEKVDEYYNKTAAGYNELHGEEQNKKLKIIKQEIKTTKNDWLLDVGCGTGISSNWNCNVVGIDPNVLLLCQNDKMKVLGSGESLPFLDKSFDYIISLTAFHHINDMKKGLNEAIRVCKNKIAISFLKKSSRLPEFEKLIKGLNFIEQNEDKDKIFIISL